MAYEYEMKNLIAKLSGVWVESEKKEILKELEEVYQEAQAFDNYMADLAKTMEEYPNNFYNFYGVTITYY